MKILYCIAGTFRSGGMERVLTGKANYLARHGHEIVIVTTDQRGQQPFFPLDGGIRCIDLGISYDDNNGKSLWNKLSRYPLKQWRHRRRLTGVLLRERPDVTVCMFNNDAGFIPRIKDGSRKVLEIHFSKFKRLQYGRAGLWRLIDLWRSRQDERIVRRFDRFVVLTEEDKGHWGAVPGITVIPNACPFVCDAPASLTEKKVLAVGRLARQKGFDRLLDAWALVCREESGWQLEIIGDGDMKDALLQQIHSLGLDGSVTLRQPVENIMESYQRAAILAMSSHYEGYPMVLIEAAAAGLPAVSFDCKCGPKEIIEDGVTGFLVPQGDVQALAGRLMTLMRDDALRKKMGRSAFEASARFSEETVMRRWTELFESLQCGSGTRGRRPKNLEKS